MALTQTRNVGPLSLRAALRSFDAEKRTAEVVWSQGAKVLRNGWDGQFFEVLSMDPSAIRMGRLTSGRAPLLDSHSSFSVGSVLGVVESARVENGQGIATVRFASAGLSAEADKAFALVRDGVLTNISVGYRTYRAEKTDDAKIPTIIARDWEPYELSIVPMGADAGASFRDAPEDLNPCEFINHSRNTETNAMTPEEIEAKRLADLKAAETRAAELESATRAALKAERERAASVRTLVRSLQLGDDLAEKLVNDGVSLADARTAVLEAAVARSNSFGGPGENAGHVSVKVTDDVADKFTRGASAWLFEKGGSAHVEEAARRASAGQLPASIAKRFDKIELDGGEFRGASLLDLARTYLEMRGVKTRGYNKLEMFGQAFNYRGPGYSSTTDFSVLFESVLHKQMLAAYAVQESTWPRFCGVKEVQDFRPSNFFRSGSFGVLSPLSENGEFQNDSIPDGEKSTVSVGTYGGIIALSRQAMINDDMGALSGVAAQRGQDAKRTIESKVFEQLALNSNLGPTVGGVIFFSTTNGNINATAAANTSASWDLDAYKMSQQMDASGNHFLKLVPSVLLLPRAKLTEALVLNKDQFDPAQTGQKSNSAQGMAKDIIATSDLTGTRRYWFCNPAQNPAIVVGFLAGSGQAPVMFTQEGWRTDGTEWKFRMDFGVSFFDPKCALTNAGA